MLDTVRWRERLVAGWGGVLARLPMDCARCGSRVVGPSLCGPCTPDLIHEDPAPRCPVCQLALAGGVCVDCAHHVPAYDRVVAAFDYQGVGRDLVLLYKAGRRFQLARALGGLLGDAIADSAISLPRSTILVPVPARREALLRRGFSPAAEVARILALRFGLMCDHRLLWRAIEGSKQAMLGGEARRAALEGVYRCGPVPAGCRVAVVDDVLTTGSTLDAIARQLKIAGAATVTGLVLARAAVHGGRPDRVTGT